MPVVVSSGSQTAVISTEHTLFEDTTNFHYSFSLSKANMVSGDTLEIRVYKKVRTGDSQELLNKWTYTDAQTEDDGIVWHLSFVSCPFGCKFTLKQTAGTGRAYSWSVERP